MKIQEVAKDTGCKDDWVIRALILTVWTEAHTLHHPQKVGVESLEGEDKRNPANKQSHDLKEWLYKNHGIAVGAMLWHTKIC